MSRTFTGKHMLLVMLGFFGTIIAVNFTMAWLASDTFGGTVVDNSYVASQRFNGWLKQSRDQAALGWQIDLGLDATRRPVIAVTTGGTAASGFAARGTAHHPLGRAPDIALDFSADADGRLVSDQMLPPGRWQVRIDVSRDGRVMRLAETLQ